MRIAHIADPHLGYRAYHRVTSRGVNVREADVDAAFRQAIDRVVALDPDLVLIAGDVFHTVRPANAVIASAFRSIAYLREERPRLPVLMIAGNHDSPKAVETGNILSLLQEIPGVVAVTQASERIRLDDIGASVLCVPHNALSGDTRPALDPDPEADVNLLMLHGTVGGKTARRKIRFLSEYGGEIIHDRTIGPDRWDYVALGHYHIATDLAPNMWYPGALERTSTNIWIEDDPKGFILYDTDTREAEFHEVATRPMVDLVPLDAKGLTAEEIDRAIRAKVDQVDDGIDDKLVRLVVTDLPRHVARNLDHTALREYRARALHFRLDFRRPEARNGTASSSESSSPPARTVEEEFDAFVQNAWKPTTPDIRQSTLLQLGRKYLAATEEMAE